MPVDDFVQRSVAGCREAHGRLRATIEGLTDELAIQPSRLPGWQVAHVLTHIARNADSHVRMLRGALTDQHLEQYAGGMDERARDIEAGAKRPAAELVEDVLWSAVALEAAWDEMTSEAWNGFGLGGSRLWPCSQMPVQRWREVEVHHVDLGLGYEIDDWPGDYVELELSNLPADDATRQLVAWIMGRAGHPDPSALRPWTSGG